MRAKFVFESVEDNSQEIVKEIIEKNIRTKKTKEKFFDYLKRIYSFDENSPNIDKKEFTQIYNQFSDLLRQIFNDKRDEYTEEIKALAIEKGYSSLYDAYDTQKDPIFKILHWINIYYLKDILRKYNDLQDLNLDGKFQKFIDKWYPNFKELSEFAEKVEYIRSILMPSKEEKQARATKQIKGKINPEIKSAIDEIAEDFRKVIEEKEYDRRISIITKFQVHFLNGISRDNYMDRKNRYYMDNIGMFIQKENPKDWNSNYIISPNYKELVRKTANSISIETIQKWQFKMYNKLGGFISELGKKFTTKVIGSRYSSHDIVFNFEDGSKFTINNQIVSKVSNLGTYFYTYPTTFHNAHLPDGSRIAQPSEYSVKKAFNDYPNQKA